MKFSKIKKWENIEDTQGLLFFAQRLTEMLFDYSLDTYKAPALNSFLICLELLELINLVEENIIDKANISHVLEELKDTINNDKIFKSMMNFDVDLLFEHTETNFINLDTLKTRLRIVLNQISEDEYINEIEKSLFFSIENNNKDDIFALSRIYITSLINYGYHSNYLYKTAIKYFFYDKKIVSNSNFHEFIEKINRKRKKYTVVFVVSKLFSEIKDSCEKFGVSLLEKKNQFESYIKRHDFKLGEKQIYLSANEFEAYDYISARQRAERTLKNLQKAFILFHHKEKISWNNRALIIDIDSEKSFTSNAPISPMLKGIDLRPDKASNLLNRFINDFSLDSNSFDKFFSAITLHGLSVSNEAIENQLLNIWTCFEIIVPSKSGSGKTKITNIIELIIPFLMINYHNRLIEKLLSDIFNWNKVQFNKILKKVDGSDAKEKLIKLLICEDYSKVNSELKCDFKDFVLLRNRFYKIGEIIKSTKNIKKNLYRHEKRVVWQLRRIYRTRNLIVHSGNTPPFTSILVENAHDYLDIILKEIIILASDGYRANTLEECYEIMHLKYNNYKKMIDGENEHINCDNFRKYLIS